MLHIKTFMTDPKHSDMIDSIAYMIAAEEAKITDEFILLHVKKRPWWMPERLYRFIIRQVLVMAKFK